MKILLGVLVLAVAIGASPGAHAASACASASANMHSDLMTDDLSPTPDPNIDVKLAAEISKCRVGDVVWIPSSITYLIAKTCDFSRQIVVLPQAVQNDPYSAVTMCIVGPPKGDD